MTQDEKLDLLIQQVGIMGNQLSSIDSRLAIVEQRMDSSDLKVEALDQKVDRIYKELKSMDEAILDEVLRVHHILDRHKADKQVHFA